MTISGIEPTAPAAMSVQVTNDTLSVELTDGRTISVPLAWSPRLVHATRRERNSWRLIGRGHGIHWPSIDEDVSVENLLAGKPSGESQESFKNWLASRGKIGTKVRARPRSLPGRVRTLRAHRSEPRP